MWIEYKMSDQYEKKHFGVIWSCRENERESTVKEMHERSTNGLWGRARPRKLWFDGIDKKERSLNNKM